jgi:tRNA (guanine26-N2/guanine27-N2)-dimethyltransferase
MCKGANRGMNVDDFKPHFPTEIITEGKVKVLVPKLKAYMKMPSEYAPSKAPVFYNPIMELNRDLSVLAVQVYQRMLDKNITVCDPLTACGIRGLRYALEVTNVRKIVNNDINENAVQLARYNIRLNGCEKKVFMRNEDANLLLSKHSAPHKRFNVIDIDPFGSPVPYLDSAIRALRNGGILAMTATDMAPLCGVHSKACIRKYGGKPLRTEYCHELAVRLLAGCLATTAAKRDIGVSMVFSHRMEHYVRLYVTINYGAKEGDKSVEQLGYIRHCFKCFHREETKGSFNIEQPLVCSECNSRLSIAGPLWLGKIVDKRFLESMQQEAKQRMLKNGERIGRILSLIKNEAEAPSTYYVIDKICSALRLPVPSVKKVAESLRERGYSACLTHFNSRGIRSDASASIMTEIVKSMTITNRQVLNNM